MDSVSRKKKIKLSNHYFILVILFFKNKSQTGFLTKILLFTNRLIGTMCCKKEKVVPFVQSKPLCIYFLQHTYCFLYALR